MASRLFLMRCKLAFLSKLPSKFFTSPALEKYHALSFKTPLLKSLLCAAINAPDAIASSREGFVPPTECP